MPAMTDPMQALISLQNAVDHRLVRLQRCDLYPDLRVLLDQPAGKPRNKLTRAVRAADLTETRRVSRTIPSISPIALPRLPQYYGEKIGTVCKYVRDVRVAGSNPVTPTIFILNQICAITARK
jgi:hypothetical protein